MADGIKVQVTGAAELVSFLNMASDEVALKACRSGAQAGAARMRTLLRRAAPIGSNSKTRIKMGWPALNTLFKSASGRPDKPIAWAGFIGRAPYYYNTLDFGRKAFSRNGKPVAGSPAMRPWFDAAVNRASQEVVNTMTRSVMRGLIKESARVIARTGAPIKFRGSE
jgi:hypothetical protein